ncbi:hypothetical protein ACLOAU_14730 [Niabella sp. CJ426]|uniref:hypothetical protein n=1 Tax=Niabella sp. CJ426 TaxID=3393740 RepID=UPI003D030E6E
MTTLATVFAQQIFEGNPAWENIIEVSGKIEEAGIQTFAWQERSSVYLGVEQHLRMKPHDIVYRYWHKGEQM